MYVNIYKSMYVNSSTSGGRYNYEFGVYMTASMSTHLERGVN